MTRPRLYGISGSRAQRSLWAIEEVGIDYEHVKVSYMEDSKTPEYLAVNPNGKVPALVDGDLTLFESMAINLYLAKTYGGALYPSNPADEARSWQWSVWGISEIEPLQMQIVLNTLLLPEEKRSEKAIASATRQLVKPLSILDAALADRDYLLGDNFSVADLNVAGVMLLLGMVKFDLSAHNNLTRWTQACYARPALARAQAL